MRLFQGKLLEMSKKENVELENENNEKDSVIDVCLTLIRLCKSVSIFTVSYIIQLQTVWEVFLPGPSRYMKTVEKDMQLNVCSFCYFLESGSKEVMKTFGYFYLISRKFHADENLISAPDSENPDFVNLQSSSQKILPFHL